MDEATPIEIRYMSAGTGTDEARGHDRPPIEPPFVIERSTVHKTAGAFFAASRARLLHDHPGGEAPDSNAQLGLAGRGRVWRRGEQPRSSHAGHHRDLPSQPYVDDFLEGADTRPSLEATNNPGVPGKIN